MEEGGGEEELRSAQMTPFRRRVGNLGVGWWGRVLPSPPKVTLFVGRLPVTQGPLATLYFRSSSPRIPSPASP
eukprot:177545-Hanusia_phi.AAC.1